MRKFRDENNQEIKTVQSIICCDFCGRDICGGDGRMNAQNHVVDIWAKSRRNVKLGIWRRTVKLAEICTDCLDKGIVVVPKDSPHGSNQRPERP